MKAWALAAATAIGVATLAAGSGGAATAPRWIVFAAARENGQLPSQLFRISTAGTGLRQLTTGARAADEPAFSPDGRHVAFRRAFAGLFVVDIDGRGLRRLTGDPNDRFGVWSPDGRSIAFVHPVKGGGVRLAVIAPSGHRQRVLRRGPEPIGRPSWTPNGKAIVIASHGGFFRVSASTGKVEQRLAPTYKDNDGEPVWTLSPNGRTLALVARRPEPPGCQGLACEVFALYLVGTASTHPRRFADDIGFAGWTPDSRRLVYATRSGLAVRPVTAGSARTIPVAPDLRPIGDAPPAWQP
jgi:dipeptidyl aminopeptidase/acylaminoacyl peptidase